MSYRRWTGLREDNRRDEENPVELDVLGVQEQDVVVPVFIYPCPTHPDEPSTEERELSSNQGERIKIVVRSGSSMRTFLVHKRLVCRFSHYFEVALKEGNETLFVEAATGEFEWHDDDPQNVHCWVRWLYSCESCKMYGIYDRRHLCPDTADDPNSWCSVSVHAEEAFILGDRIGCSSYCTFALSHFIQHVHLLHPTTVLWVYENTLEHSSLHRFIAHWIAWIKFKVYKKEPLSASIGQDIYLSLNDVPEDLMAEDHSIYANVFALSEGWSSIDPRNYFMAHWSDPCSKTVNARCHHKRACHYFASYATKFQVIEEPDAILRLGFQLEHGRLHRVREGPRPRSRWTYVDQFMVVLWWASLAVVLFIAPVIYIKADASLLKQQAKVTSIVAAVLGLLGCYFCRSRYYLNTLSWNPILSREFAFAMVLVGDMIYSAATAGRAAAGCFKMAMGDDILICKLEAVIASMEVLYASILAGFMVAYWKQWLPMSQPGTYSMNLVYY